MTISKYYTGWCRGIRERPQESSGWETLPFVGIDWCCRSWNYNYCN
jgi:hypothetical protein